MSTLILSMIAGFLAGFIGALGLGGGAVLVLFLTVFASVPQLRAQGINLLFFIPVGFFALIWHCRKHLVVWRTALPAILAGLAGALGGSLLTRFFGGDTVRMLFGLMLLGLGCKELFGRQKPDKKSSVTPDSRGHNCEDNRDNPAK